MKEEEEKQFPPHWPLPHCPYHHQQEKEMLHLTTTVIRFLARLAVEEGQWTLLQCCWTKKVAAESHDCCCWGITRLCTSPKK